MQNFAFKNISSIETVSSPLDMDELFGLLDNENLPVLKGGDTIFDWSKVNSSFDFNYDFEREESITEWLKGSSINKEEFVFIHLNTGDPIYKITTIAFSENWENLMISTGWLGFVFWTGNSEYFGEFTDDHHTELRSNFKIKP